MSSQYALKITEEQAREMPMVDLAFVVLKAANTPFYYLDLMQEIAKIKELSEEEMMQVIAQLYTEINIDGRFACVGNNLWGLKRWYPVEKSGEEGYANTQRPRIINDEDDEDDEDFYAEEEETYEEEEFPALDDDLDEYRAVAEEEEFFEEEDLDEETLDSTEMEVNEEGETVDESLSEDDDEEEDK